MTQSRGLAKPPKGYTTPAGRYCTRTCMACDRPLTVDHNDELCLKCLTIVWDCVPSPQPSEEPS